MKTSLNIFFFCILFFIQAALLQSENLIIDPSFEDIKNITRNGNPWRVIAYTDDPGYSEFKIETGNAHSGEKFVTIINHRKNHARFSQRVSVESRKTYRLSCWVKTENVGTDKKGGNITEEGIIEISPQITGTTDDWMYTEMYLKTGEGIESIVVSLCLGGYYGTNTGKASFDDVSVEEVDDIPQGAVVATKGKYEKKDTTKKRNEEERVRIIREPATINITVLIAVILAAVGAVLIIIRIVFINMAKKKTTGEQKPKQNQASHL